MNETYFLNRSLACEEAEIIDIHPLGQQKDKGGYYFELHLSVASAAWKQCRAGQFVMLRPLVRDGWEMPFTWGNDLIWGRAFSICRTEQDGNSIRIVLFMQVVGRGTFKLRTLKTGDKLLVWGPLGNAFAAEDETPTLLLAGGMGIAPFIYYASAHPNPKKLLLEFGHRVHIDCYPVNFLPCEVEFYNHFEKNNDDLLVFLDIIKQRMIEYSAMNGLILACGPKPFLKTIHEFAMDFKARTQLSLETQMACGSGACLGCTVKAGSGLKCAPLPEWPVQVCLCGPVFWAEEISFA